MGTRLLVIVFATFLLNGCSALENINEELAGGQVAATEEENENCGENVHSEGCTKKSVNGWANIRSLSSNNMKADVVSCSVGNAVQFTTHNGLSPGVHSNTITFKNTTNGAGNTSRTVNLTVNVNAAPGAAIQSILQLLLDPDP